MQVSLKMVTFPQAKWVHLSVIVEMASFKIISRMNIEFMCLCWCLISSTIRLRSSCSPAAPVFAVAIRLTVLPAWPLRLPDLFLSFHLFLSVILFRTSTYSNKLHRTSIVLRWSWLCFIVPHGGWFYMCGIIWVGAFFRALRYKLLKSTIIFSSTASNLFSIKVFHA